MKTITDKWLLDSYEFTDKLNTALAQLEADGHEIVEGQNKNVVFILL